VQIFKDEDERLVETLAQEQLLERFKRPSPADLRVHLLERKTWIVDAKEREEIRQRVFQLRSSMSTLPPIFSRRVRSSSCG